MFMVEYIEFICSANYTRSPLLAHVANLELKRRGITRYEAISSGTLVKTLSKSIVEEDKKVSFIERAIEAGFFDGVASFEPGLVHALTESDRNRLYRIAASEFISREQAYKASVYKKYGANLKRRPLQTRVRGDVVAIFPVDLSNKVRVEQIYNSVPEVKKPIIRELMEYTGEKGNGETLAPVLRGEKAFQDFLEDLIVLVPKALDQLFEEFSKKNS